MLLTASAFAQDAKSIYHKYSDADNVDSVYISPAMFKLIGKLPDMDVNSSGMDLSGIIKSFSGFYVLDSGNPEVNAALKNEVQKLVNKGRYEMLMEAKGDGETTRIYADGDETTVNSFVLFSIDREQCTFLSIEGKMSREDIEKIIAQ